MKRINRQTVHKILHRKLSTERQEPHKKKGLTFISTVLNAKNKFSKFKLYMLFISLFLQSHSKTKLNMKQEMHVPRVKINK